MPMYDYPDDGNLHTRYSELTNCQTMAGAYRVAEEKLGLTQRHSNAILEFGSLRHDAWEQEAIETGLTPECFAKGTDKQFFVIEAEQHRATEIFKGVVFHFTTDAVVWPETEAPHSNNGIQELVDYKTGTDTNQGTYPKYYSHSEQLPIYALLLRPHGYSVKHGHYLVELWNRNRTELKGYMHVERDITLRDLATAKAFLKKGTENLMVAMAAVAKHNKL
jgi:hypothetical protein